MSGLRSALLVVIVLAAVLSPSLQDCCSDACFQTTSPLGKGEVLKRISLDKTTAFKDDQLCGPAFKAKGSCCDSTQLNTFVTKMIERLKANFLAIESATSNAPSILKGFGKLSEMFKSKNPSGTTPDAPFIASLGGDEQYYKILSMVQHIETQLDDLRTMIANKQFDPKKCYDTLFKSKVASICMICSGDASSFFDDVTGKFKIKRNFCQDIVAACAPSLDLFNKINHLMEVTRVIRSGLMSETVKQVRPEFSQDRLSVIEDCARDPDACKANEPKLIGFCREVGVTKDIKVVKSSENQLTDTNELRTDAEAGFTTALTNEVNKLKTAIQNKAAEVKKFDPADGASIPAKSGTVGGFVTGQLPTANNGFIAADQACKGALTDALRSTARADRRVKLDQLITTRIGFFQSVSDVLSGFIDALKGDMSSDQFDTLKPTYSDAVNLKKEAEEAIVKMNTFKTDKQTYDATEIAAGGGPIPFATLDEFWKKFGMTNEAERSLVAKFGTIKPKIDGFVGQKKLKLDDEVTKMTAAQRDSALRNAQAPFQKSIDTKSDEKSVLVGNRDNALLNANTKSAFATKLGANDVPNQLQSVQNDHSTASSELGKISTGVQGILDKIPTDPAGARTDAQTAATNIQTLITLLTNQKTAAAQKQTGGDPTKKALDDVLAALNTEKATRATALQTAKTALDTAFAAVDTARADHQASMKAALAKKQELDAYMPTVNAARQKVMDLQRQKNEALGPLQMKQIDATKTLEYLALQKTTNCGIITASNQQYCSDLDAKITTATAAQTDANTQITSTTTTFDGQLTVPNQDLTAAQTSLDALRAALGTLQTAIKTKDDIVRTKTAALVTADGNFKKASKDVEMTDKKITMETENRDSYTKIVGTAWADKVGAQVTLLDQSLARLKALQTILNNLGSSQESAAPASGFVTDLRAKKGDVDASQSSADTEKASVGALHANVNSALTGAKDTAASAATASSAEKANLDAAIATKDTEITSLTQQKAAVTVNVRLLQAVDSDEDFTLDDTAGADVGTTYTPGVTINTDTSSSTAFGDSATSPGTSSGSQGMSYLVGVISMSMLGMIATL